MHVAAPGLRRHARHEGGHVRRRVRLDALRPEVRHQPGDVQLLAVGHLVVLLGDLEARARARRRRRGVLLLVDVAAAGVGARLEHRPQPPVRVAVADGGDGLPHRRRVVREVVHHQDAAHLSADLLPPLHAVERGEALGECSRRSAPSARAGREDAERVLHVVQPRTRQVHRPAPARAPPPRSARPRAEGQVLRVDVRRRALLRRVRHHLRPSPRARERHRVGVRGADRELAASGHQARRTCSNVAS